jgi:hypothetical protein
MEAIEETRRRYEADLLALPNVTGVGIGEQDGKPVIKVLVTEKVSQSTLEPGERLPESIEGWRVVVEEVGQLAAEQTEEEK